MCNILWRVLCLTTVQWVADELSVEIPRVAMRLKFLDGALMFLGLIPHWSTSEYCNMAMVSLGVRRVLVMPSIVVEERYGAAVTVETTSFFVIKYHCCTSVQQIFSGRASDRSSHLYHLVPCQHYEYLANTMHTNAHSSEHLLAVE